MLETEPKIIAACVAVAFIAGLIHASLGMGYGMIAMATLTAVIPYNQASAIVSANLLILVVQISISLREYIDWKGIAAPTLSLLVFKIIGIVLMMHLQSGILRIALGVFLIAYSTMQLMQVKMLQIKGSRTQGIVLCGLGGLFGGIFNVSGPFASIFCQAKYGEDPKKYAANMNAIFVPSAVAALVMHICYGNFSAEGYIGSAVMTAGILVATYFGVGIIKRINPKRLRVLSYLYIIFMGITICISA